MKLSVVIPTYNRLSTLPTVLQRFSSQSIPFSEFEIILVDSMSTDGTEEFAEKFKSSCNFRFRYIRQGDRGRPGARNRGIREARGDVVVFIDSDIIPETTFLEKHLEFHERHSKAAAVGWESRIDSLSELEDARRSPETRFRIHSLKRKKLHWLYFLTGNASVSRKHLIEVGLFDEAFQGYGFEDLELGYRLQKAGIQIYYLAEALNYHVHPRTFDAQAEVQRMAGHNAVLFYRKHKDWRIRWLLGMSPPALLWHRILKSFPFLFRLLKSRAVENGSKNLPREILSQHYYLMGVEEAWKLKK